MHMCIHMFSILKLLYCCTAVKACLIVCLYLLRLGVLCLLRMCGVYVRHHLPPLHPRPMAVFRCQHLRMGPVCLAHRLVQVFCRLIFISASHTDTFTSKTLCTRNSPLPSFFKSVDLFIFYLPRLLLSHRERSLSTHCVAVDPICVHRGCHTVQRSEELSCRPLSTLCCSLVNGIVLFVKPFVRNKVLFL